MPEDPFAALGFSRRPADELFGVAPATAAGFGRAAKNAMLEDKLIQRNQRRLANTFAEEARTAEAEEAADAYTRLPAAQRQQFFEDNPQIVGSERYREIADYQQRQPSYADKVLFQTISNKLPVGSRNRFSELVAQGIGVNAARDQVEMEEEDKLLELSMIESGIHPDEVRQHRDPQTGLIVPQKATWAITQKKLGAKASSDPDIVALDKYRDILKEKTDRIIERNYRTVPGSESPLFQEYQDTVAELENVENQLAAKFRGVFQPKTPVTAGAPVPAPTTTARTSAEAKAALLKKLNILK